MGYISNFIVYTLAMIGVIAVALLVCKNATGAGGGKASKHLKIIDSLYLGQRKHLYIVSTGKEQFLIAGDVNNTNLISKLEGINQTNEPKKDLFDGLKPAANSFKETLENLPKQSYIDKTNIGITSGLLNKKQKTSVMRNLADIMRSEK